MAPSSSGLGRRPLKAKVAGSNPVGATKCTAEAFASAFFVISDTALLLDMVNHRVKIAIDRNLHDFLIIAALFAFAPEPVAAA